LGSNLQRGGDSVRRFRQLGERHFLRQLWQSLFDATPNGTTNSKSARWRILTVLMQERARINSEDGVRALNSIDIVFADSREVREAWAELLLAFNMQPLVMHVVEERLRRLLAAVAKDVGIADQLRIDDLGRVYYPTSHQQEQQIKDMQRQFILNSLMQKNAAGANSVFPPKP
jgi:AcrR family transcriptional regulator